MRSPESSPIKMARHSTSPASTTTQQTNTRIPPPAPLTQLVTASTPSDTGACSTTTRQRNANVSFSSVVDVNDGTTTTTFPNLRVDTRGGNTCANEPIHFEKSAATPHSAATPMHLTSSNMVTPHHMKHRSASLFFVNDQGVGAQQQPIRRGSMLPDVHEAQLRQEAARLGLREHGDLNNQMYGRDVLDGDGATVSRPMSLMLPHRRRSSALSAASYATSARHRSVAMNPSFGASNATGLDTSAPELDDDDNHDCAPKGLVDIHLEALQNFDELYLDKLTEPQKGDPLYFLPIFLPESPEMRKWDVLLSVLTLYSLIKVPYEIAFDSRVKAWAIVLNTIFDFCFIADIFVHFRTAYRTRFGFETRWDKIRNHYFGEWFFFDLAPAFPMDLVLYLSTTGGGEDFSFTKAADSTKCLRLPRLFRLLRLFRLFRIYGSNGSLGAGMFTAVTSTHVTGIVFIFLLMVHWVACFLWLVVRDDTDPSAWVNVLDVGDDRDRQYVYSFGLAVSNLLMFGTGSVEPKGVGYIVAFAMVRICGALLYAFMIGYIVAHTVRTDSHIQYERRLDEVTDYLREFDVPATLRNKVRNYFEHRYTNHKVFSLQNIFESVSTPLRTEIRMHIYSNILNSTPWVRYCPEGFVVSLVNVLQESFTNPGDIVFAQGSVAQCLYFIGHGLMSIFDRDNLHIAEFTDGDTFGDETILNVCAASKREEAYTYYTSAVSCGYAEIVCLSAHDLSDLLAFFPRVRSLLERSAHNRLADMLDDESLRYRSDDEDDDDDDNPNDAPVIVVVPTTTTTETATDDLGSPNPLGATTCAVGAGESTSSQRPTSASWVSVNCDEPSPLIGGGGAAAQQLTSTRSNSGLFSNRPKRTTSQLHSSNNITVAQVLRTQSGSKGPAGSSVPFMGAMMMPGATLVSSRRGSSEVENED
eukprot:PhM_4_TR7106/c0_g1_i1/m.91340